MTNVAQVTGEVEEQPTSKMGLPIALFQMVEAAAKERDIPVRAVIREAVAAQFKYDGPMVAPRQKTGVSDLESKPIAELRTIAKDENVTFTNEMTVTDLAAAIAKKRRQNKNKKRRAVFAALLEKFGDLDALAALVEETSGDEDEDEEDEEDE